MAISGAWLRFDQFFEEAVAFFGKKGITISPNSWRDVWADANLHAFTVARVTAMDVLVDIKSEVDRAISDGITLEEFQEKLGDRLTAKGWMTATGQGRTLAPWRLQNIFRTNLASAANVGRYIQMDEMRDRRPWWQYMAIMDRRTRPEHAAQNGKVFPASSSFWARWYPPNGFMCRCYVRSMRDKDLERRGLKPQTELPKEMPDEGWNYSPAAGMNSWKPNLRGYPEEARKMLQGDLDGRR